MTIRWIALYICLFINGLAQAQSFTFADTHPVNNPDSLEQWFAANPEAPALVRLKTLITLERTYRWVNKNRLGAYFGEIDRLVKSCRQPAAQAAYLYLQGERYYQINQRFKAAQAGNQALRQFQSLHDTSGQVHANCLLTFIHIRSDGLGISSDNTLLSTRLQTAGQLTNQSPNSHDKLLYAYLQFSELYGSGRSSMSVPINTALSIIAHDKTCQYARPLFLKLKAITYYWEKEDYWRSYQLNKKVATLYKPNQLQELTNIYCNLGNDCYRLHRADEALVYYKKAIEYALRCSPIQYFQLTSAYDFAGRIAAKKGRWQQAYFFAHKLAAYTDTINQKNNDAQMLELEGRYDAQRRKQEMVLLKQNEAAATYRNQVFTYALSLATVVLLLIGFLSLKLYQNRNKIKQTNTHLEETVTELNQLNRSREHFMGIIAHDMRKPLVSLRGLASLISTLLKQKAYHDIQQLAVSIDSTGLQIEAMLDNLLKWALAQRESIPYQPQAVPLAQTLGEVVSLYQQLTHLQGTVLLLSGADNLWVWADPNGLQLIVRNLIDNALKHVASDGQILIRCGEWGRSGADRSAGRWCWHVG